MQSQNKNRKQLSPELMLDRIKSLMNEGRTGAPVANTAQSSRATLMHKVQGADGLTYGILQENAHFFLKKTTKNVNEAQSADFEYIGGAQNILAERFNSASDAHRRLNAKLFSLHESIGDIPAPDQEEDLLNKLNQKDDEESQAPEAGAPVDGMGAEAGGADPLAGLEGGDAPAPEGDAGGADPLAGLEGGDAPAPEGDAPAPEGDAGGADPLAGLEGGDAPAPEGEAAPEDGAADDLGLDAEGGAPEGEGNPEGGEEGDGSTTDAMKTLGKLGQQLDAIGELSPEFAKTVLNTVITKSQRALGNMSDEDKEKIQQRIGKDGKKIDEDVMDSGTEAEKKTYNGTKDLEGDAWHDQDQKNKSSYKNVPANWQSLEGKMFEIPATSNGRRLTLPLEVRGINNVVDAQGKTERIVVFGSPVAENLMVHFVKYEVKTNEVEISGYVVSPEGNGQAMKAQYQLPQELVQMFKEVGGNNSEPRQDGWITIHKPGTKLQESWDTGAARDDQYNQYQNSLDRNERNAEQMPSYQDFMDKNGFGDKDEDIIKGLAAFNDKLRDMEAAPTQQDIEQIVKEMNPFIWSNLDAVDDSLLMPIAKAGGVDMNGENEWPGGTPGAPSTPQIPMHESWGSVASLTRLLVRSELNKSKI